MTKQVSILLVEDDRNLGFVIQDNLEQQGFQVALCDNGEEALRLFRGQVFDLCVLDVMLPKMDGISLARTIRQTNITVPIIFLTAKAMKDDKIAGFKAGGDDYLTKPFSIEELLLRIQVFLKRSQNGYTKEQEYVIGEYQFDYANRHLVCQSDSRHLTHKEAEVLKLLCENQGRVMKRDEILVQVWGNDDYFTGRSLDVFITRLRKYLKQDAAVGIVNYHGIGFKLDIQTPS